MALFTDGNIASPTDLRDQETGILDAAHAEGIELGTKLRVAQEELGVELVAFLLEHGPAALAEESIRALRHVAVTPALRQWHAMRALALVYRDLYYSQFNDRYGEKWKEYERLAKSAAGLLFQTGIGLVLEPVERAGIPTLSTVGGALGSGTYFARISWVSPLGAEGEASETTGTVTEENTRLVVTPPEAPPLAAGWRVYAGTKAQNATLQDDRVLTSGESWTMPESGLRAGRGPSTGQTPDIYVTLRRTLRRA